MWDKSVRQMRQDTDVRVQCTVVGSVFAKDLDRTFEYGHVEIVSFADYQKSKDLRNAINKGWIQALDRYSSYNTQQQIQQPAPAVKQQQINLDNPDTKKMIQDVAKEMAKEIAKEMVTEILDKMPKQKEIIINQQIQDNNEAQTQNKLKAVEIDEETFVKMSTQDEDVKGSLSLNKESDVKIVSSDSIQSSLAKMRALKKKKSVEELNED